MSAYSTLMKCGHSANATTQDGAPVCVICLGIVPGADEVDENPPDLEGRTARCVYCRKERPSAINLAFFEHLPEHDYDRYYCGCYGWN